MCFYCKLQRELATCYKIRLSFIFGIFIYVNKKWKISKKKPEHRNSWTIYNTIFCGPSVIVFIHTYFGTPVKLLSFRHRELDTRLETTALMFVLNMYCNL